MKYSIGIDIGASKISFAVLQGKRVAWRKKVSTPKNRKRIIGVIENNIKELRKVIARSSVSGIGIGIAGPLNKKGDLILNPPNIKSLWNCPLANIIEKDLKIKTIMENDVNCFALAEALMGAGKGGEAVLGITLGSGIGGGLVFKKGNKYEIYKGAFGSAGEAGHMVIKLDGVRCRCGRIGCFEEYASERFIKRKTNISPKELEKKAKRGNLKARKIYKELGKNLGIGLANLVNILDPEVIVVGGGISKVGSLILNPAKREVRKKVLSTQSKKSVKIKLSKLSDFSGAVGAALLVK